MSVPSVRVVIRSSNKLKHKLFIESFNHSKRFVFGKLRLWHGGMFQTLCYLTQTEHVSHQKLSMSVELYLLVHCTVADICTGEERNAIRRKLFSNTKS